MASRPAKRQRRSTLTNSDDNQDYVPPATRAFRSSTQREITRDGKTSSNPSPTKPAKTKPVAKRQPPKPSPKSSPDKSRKNSAKSPKSPEKSKSLHSFFSKVTEEERWRKKSLTPDLISENGELGDDIIEDDDLSDETLQELGSRANKAATSLERPKPLLSSVASLKNGLGSAPSSQRFVHQNVSNHVKVKVEDEDAMLSQTHRPWADRYGPQSLDELVVHKKKVSDKILVLKGPAGSGKTTTVALLAKSMGLQLVFWQNPGTNDGGRTNSIAVQFAEFLNRGGQFESLVLAKEHSSSASDVHGRILVVEEFPTSNTSVQSFRSAVQQYLARGRAGPGPGFSSQPPGNEPPVVMIISETLLSSSTALSDSFTAHRLLGPEILNHPYVTTIEFNPVATTFVSKALDLVIKKEARDSKRRRIPGPAVIQQIAEMGDVRSAVNSLEFLCLRNEDGSEWSGRVAGVKAKKSSKDALPLTEMEKNSLQLISQRETTLDMFHAVGKIVYNKREDPRVQDTRAEPPPKPPDHLLHLYTPKASLVDFDALLNETGTDIQTFISTIHENYILSCNGDLFDQSFDGCSETLSASDVLNPDSRPSRRANNNPNASIIQANLQAGSSDTLRQDEISFQVATRGVLFNLPNPVNRASVPGGKRGDNFKMFYPQSLRLWKKIEETDSMVAMLSHDVGANHSPGSNNTLSSDADQGVATWRSRGIGNGVTPAHMEVGDGRSDEEEPPLTYQLRRSRDTMIMEILPFAQRILSARAQDTRILDRITKFRPSAFNPSLSDLDADVDVEAEGEVDASFHDDRMDAGSDATGVASSTMPPPPYPLLSKSRFQTAGLPKKGLGSNTAQTTTAPTPAIETLYLEEDDIVDDY
ncbi:hypothetical protein B0A52_05721 [Exophiala mesophila]|uniref:Checkpoint protein RAD24-like helical bundle domain-containing protein n=1 Tax=Exophiala mesophila TaxID=212818 RepID=A0A438N2D8_EXOME|nr:hypothetical protein B0A52_05721 [Exophiala mesophila]